MKPKKSDIELTEKALLFKFFSLLFLPPDKERTSKLKEIAKYFKTTEKYRCRIFDLILESELTGDERMAYTMLFRTGFNPAHPYEGAYIPQQYIPALHVKLSEEYIKEGLVEKEGDFPDHISTLLEFTSFLYFKGKEEKSAEFMKKHMWWLGRFYKRAENKAQELGIKEKANIYLEGIKSLRDLVKKETGKTQRKPEKR